MEKEGENSGTEYEKEVKEKKKKKSNAKSGNVTGDLCACVSLLDMSGQYKLHKLN